MIEVWTAIVACFWLLLFAIAVVVLVAVTNYFTDEGPGTLRRAVLTTLVVGVAMFFAYDLTGFALARSIQDAAAGIELPPEYTYGDWLREPIALKWHFLALAPFVRFVPIALSLLVGCVVQCALLRTPLPVGMVVFPIQVVLDLAALVLLSLAFTFVLRVYENQAGRNRPRESMLERIRAMRTDRPQATALEEAARRGHARPPESFWRRLDAQWEAWNRQAGPFYAALQPATRHLPLPAQDFLNAGGWFLVLPAFAILLIRWPRIHRQRKQLARRHRRRRPAERPNLDVDLAVIGDALTDLGPHQLTVHGSPARLRLVITAPVSASAPTGEALYAFLDHLLPALGEIARFDCPRTASWNDSLARSDFRHALDQRVKRPQPVGTPSPWILLAGEAVTRQGLVRVGLALLASRAISNGEIHAVGEQWSKILGIRKVGAEERRPYPSP